MRLFALAVLATVAVVPAIQASAQDSTAAPAATPAATSSVNPDEMVCKMGAAPTGTRLGRSRECHTQREWDRMRQEEQNRLTQQQIDVSTTRGH